MADYKTGDIRNIALMGHGGEGKTTLTEAMLYAAHIIDRQGRVEDGNTTTDFEPEEVKRHNSISAAVAPVEWAGKNINVIDIPGLHRRGDRTPARRGNRRHRGRRLHRPERRRGKGHEERRKGARLQDHHRQPDGQGTREL